MNVDKYWLTAILWVVLSLSCFQLSAESYEDSLLTGIEQQKDKTKQFLLLLELSSYYLKNNPEKALNIAHDVRMQAYNSRDFKSLASAYVQIGTIQQYHNNFQQALDQYLKAESILVKETPNESLADLYNTIGYIFYYMADYESAQDYFLKSLDVYSKIGEKSGIAKELNNIGVIYHSQENLKKALEYHSKSLEISEEMSNSADSLESGLGLKGVATSYNNIGEIYREEEKYNIALDYFRKSMAIKEKIRGNEFSLAATYSNIGIIYLNTGKFDQSIGYLEKADSLIKIYGDRFSIAESCNNLGSYYTETGNLVKAKSYFENALSEGIEIHAPQIRKTALEGLSRIYKSQGDFESAYSYFSQYKALNDSILQNESLKKITQMELLRSFEKKKKQLELVQLQKDIAQKDRLERQKLISYSLLAIVLLLVIVAGLVYRSYRSNKKFSAILKEQKDKILQKNEELVRKNEQIEKQSRELEKLSIVASKTDNAIIIADKNGNFLYVNESFTRIFGYTLDQIIDKSANISGPDSPEYVRKIVKHCIENKETVCYEIQEPSKSGDTRWIQVTLTPILDREGNVANLVAIDADITELKNAQFEIGKQRDILAFQQKEITDSIRYAQRIQGAVLPDFSSGSDEYLDYFVLFKPRDLVSGDFYYLTKVNQYMLIVAADCTGHGVPGAFMSMLGIAMLNEIVVYKNIKNAGELLDELRNKVVKALHQKSILENGSIGTMAVRDGMDLAACIIDTEKGKVQFAGANNPLYIVHVETVNPSSYEDSLVEIRGDKMPIAIFERMDSFTNHEFDFEPDKSFYIFSDGFADQFGGPRGKKFKYAPFKKLIVENSSCSMREQHDLLELEIEKWMAGIDPATGSIHQQIDDITVIGFRRKLHAN